MKRITLAVDDDDLYRAVKMEAARQGRSVKDVVSEALERWIRVSSGLTPEERRRQRKALDNARKLTSKQSFYHGDSARDIEEMRLERS
jgi:hypothetical protein